jgi:hypothetical protein
MDPHRQKIVSTDDVRHTRPCLTLTTPRDCERGVWTCSGAKEYDSDFDPSLLCSLLPGARALHTGDSRPPEVDAGDLRPPVVGAKGAGHVCAPRGSALAGPSYPIASRPVAVSDRASPGAPQRRRPPKLGSRDKRALQGPARPPLVVFY